MVNWTGAAGRAAKHSRGRAKGKRRAPAKRTTLTRALLMVPIKLWPLTLLAVGVLLQHWAR